MFTVNLLQPKLTAPSRVALAMQVGVLACATLLPAFRSASRSGADSTAITATTLDQQTLLIESLAATPATPFAVLVPAHDSGLPVVASPVDGIPAAGCPVPFGSGPPVVGHSSADALSPGTCPAATPAWRGPPALG